MERSKIVLVYYANVKRVLEFYYYMCQTPSNDDTYEFVEEWKQKAKTLSTIAESMYNRQTDWWQTATNQRVNFEENLCNAIEENKNLLSPDSFRCDQFQFDGLGLSMPPLWRMSILKIAGVIVDQHEAKRAEEEYHRPTRNESAEVARHGNGGTLQDRMSTQHDNEWWMHAPKDTIQQENKTCWMVSVFNLFINVPFLRQALHPELQQLMTDVQNHGSEGNHIFDSNMHHTCPRLPQKFKELIHTAWGKHEWEEHRKLPQIVFFWLMMIFSGHIQDANTVFLRIDDFHVLYHTPGCISLEDSDLGKVPYYVLKAEGEVSIEWLYETCQNLSNSRPNTRNVAGLISGKATKGEYEEGIRGHAAMFTYSHITGTLRICDWGDCRLRWSAEHRLVEDSYSYFSPNVNQKFSGVEALFLLLPE